MRHIALLFLFVLSIQYSFGQSPIIDTHTEIRVLSSQQDGLIYAHPLQAKQTIYSLAKVFQSNVNEIYQSNLKDKDYVFKINEIVKIPFRANVLITDPKEAEKYSKKTMVVYHVKPKDNLFRISRVLFPQSMDHIMENNDLEDFNLSIDQKLIVGWMVPNQFTAKKQSSNAKQKKDQDEENIKSKEQQQPKRDQFTTQVLPSIELRPKPEFPNERAVFDKVVSDLTQEKEQETEQSVSQKDAHLEQIEDIEKPTKKLISEKGVALYDGKISDKVNLFVLHKKAKTGSLIEIHYELSNRRVTAQVVGKIPSRLYSSEIDLILSPKVAKMLGVKDARSRVNMKYYQ